MMFSEATKTRIRKRLHDYMNMFAGVRGFITSSWELINNALIQSGVLGTFALRLPFLIVFLPLFKGSLLLSDLFKKIVGSIKQKRYGRSALQIALFTSILALAVSTVVLAILFSPVIAIAAGMALFMIGALIDYFHINHKRAKLQELERLGLEQPEIHALELERLNLRNQYSMAINALSLTGLALMIPVTIMLLSSAAFPPLGVALLFISLAVCVITTVIAFVQARKEMVLKDQIEALASESEASDTELELDSELSSSAEMENDLESELESDFDMNSKQNQVHPCLFGCNDRKYHGESPAPEQADDVEPSACPSSDDRDSPIPKP